MDINKYIGETTEYDKKQEVERRKVKSWLKSVSAFANGSGGSLLFGIADDDSLVGLKDAKDDAEFISQKIKERIDPIPQVVMKIEQEEDKDFLILHVYPGEDTPYYYIGDGVLETFVRIGNESVVADATEHKRLVLRGRNTSFDARPSDESIDNYAFTKLRSRYYAWNGISFDNKLYRSFGLVDTKGILTNAGLLMADECPIRQSRVFCTRWNGKTKASGMIDAFNALAHRDYLISGSEIHVDMYDDRMVIYSPGAMPEGRIIQDMNLEDIPSVRRNPIIADIFTQLGFMERKGSGMGKILGPYRAMPYFTERMLPTFYSDRAQFTVTFPNLIRIWKEEHPDIEINYVEDTNVPQGGTQDGTQGGTQDEDLDTWIEQQVATYPKITTEELASQSGKGIRTIKRHIAKMPHIRFIGSGYSGYWEVGEKESDHDRKVNERTKR